MFLSYKQLELFMYECFYLSLNIYLIIYRIIFSVCAKKNNLLSVLKYFLHKHLFNKDQLIITLIMAQYTIKYNSNKAITKNSLMWLLFSKCLEFIT